MNITSFLFKLARTSADIRALRSGKAATRRVKNKLLGRALARGGIWKALWK